jgi:hypothetical protein
MNQVTDALAGLSANYGPLNIATNSAGNQLNLSTTAAPLFQACLPAVGTTEMYQGNSRVIAMAFEVHNTTAEVYKQGSLCSYRMPSTPDLAQMTYSNLASTSKSTLVGHKYNSPPRTVAEASRLRNARTWDAKDGVYSTVFQTSVDNPFAGISPKTVFFDGRDEPDGGTGTVLVSAWVADASGEDIHWRAPLLNKTMPFDITGAFLTGLSAATTLTVKLRVFVERAPTARSTVLAPLASPSAGYDVHALMLYAHAINMLPAGVKVDENAFGDWWRGVLGVLKTVAGPIGAAINPFLPGAGLVGSAIQNLAGQLDTRKPVSKQIVKPKTLAARAKIQLGKTRK